MEFKIEKSNETVISLTRKIGYQPMGVLNEEYNIVRPLSKEGYPRFHIYIKKDSKSGVFVFNLHLDQKKASYRGFASHSGEYMGELVEREVQRINNILKDIK